MSTFLRWLKFNLIGGVGVALQLALLALFASVLRLHYMAATALAVELTVLHNFTWHERFTWKDRATSIGIATRILRFHLGNGLVSIVGNMLLMRLLVGDAGLPVLAANSIAILVCSLVNFFLADRWVFGTHRASPVES